MVARSFMQRVGQRLVVIPIVTMLVRVELNCESRRFACRLGPRRMHSGLDFEDILWHLAWGGAGTSRSAEIPNTATGPEARRAGRPVSSHTRITLQLSDALVPCRRPKCLWSPGMPTGSVVSELLLRLCTARIRAFRNDAQVDRLHRTRREPGKI